MKWVFNKPGIRRWRSGSCQETRRRWSWLPACRKQVQTEIWNEQY